MKWLRSSVLWGSLLVLGGLLLLLQNLGILPPGNLFWGVLLALGGVFFFSIFFQNRTNWWALVPAFTLMSVALVVILGRFAPDLAGVWGGALVLGGIGVSFLLIYWIERGQWWTLIPAGVMLTLAVVALIGEMAPEMETGGIFFLGLGATFGILSFTSTSTGQLRWAWIPAAILAVMGILLMTALGNLVAYLLPTALILLGAYLIWWTMRSR
jgi:hypothetical protein